MSIPKQESLIPRLEVPGRRSVDELAQLQGRCEIDSLRTDCEELERQRNFLTNFLENTPDCDFNDPKNHDYLRMLLHQFNKIALTDPEILDEYNQEDVLKNQLSSFMEAYINVIPPLPIAPLGSLCTWLDIRYFDGDQQ